MNKNGELPFELTGDLKKEFFKDYFDKSINSVRIALLLGAALYSFFGLLDMFMVPGWKSYIWIIRFAFVVPVLLISYFMTFYDFFRKIMQGWLSFVALVSGIGIIAMIVIAREGEGSLFYYAGLMLVIMWTYTFVKLRFVYASVVCGIIILAYEFAAVFIQDILKDTYSTHIFFSNNFFFISSNVIGMFAGYYIEKYMRKDFLQRMVIRENQNELEHEKNELKIRNDIINNELEMARDIQERIIPKTSPNENIYSLYKPTQLVGGDFLDFITFTGSEKIGLFLSDVSGHGVPAALIASMIKGGLSEFMRHSGSPAKLMYHLNNMLTVQSEENFVTAFFGIYDPETRMITYSNAGHHAPVVIHNNKIIRLKEDVGFPLSIMDNSELEGSEFDYKNITTLLPEKSKLVLYTDGLVEAKNNNRDSMFGNYTDELFLKFSSLKPMDFINNLFDNLVRFRGGNTFDDDICIVCVDIK